MKWPSLKIVNKHLRVIPNLRMSFTHKIYLKSWYQKEMPLKILLKIEKRINYCGRKIHALKLSVTIVFCKKDVEFKLHPSLNLHPYFFFFKVLGPPSPPKMWGPICPPLRPPLLMANTPKNPTDYGTLLYVANIYSNKSLQNWLDIWCKKIQPKLGPIAEKSNTFQAFQL